MRLLYWTLIKPVVVIENLVYLTAMFSQNCQNFNFIVVYK